MVLAAFHIFFRTAAYNTEIHSKLDSHVNTVISHAIA